jgi:hypothetical protein
MVCAAPRGATFLCLDLEQFEQTLHLPQKNTTDTKNELEHVDAKRR